MAYKNYSNAGAGVNVDSGSDFGPDEVMDYIGKFQQMKNADTANKRAERMALLQEANMKWNQDQTIKQQNMQNALKEWSSHGLDMGAALGSDPTASFSAPLPNFKEQWDGYSASATASGVQPDLTTFNAKVRESNSQYMNVVGTRFNALSDSIRRKNPLADPKDIDRILASEYGADNIYKNFQQAGLDPVNLNYTPRDREVGWGEWLKSFAVDPEVEGQGGRVKPGSIVGGAGAIGAGEYGRRMVQKTIQTGSADYLKAAETAWGKTGNAKEYEKTYGEKKIKSGDSRKKGAKFDASTKVSRHARNTGLSETYLGKAAKWTKGSKTLKGVKSLAKGAVPYMAPAIGNKIDETLGTGDAAQTAGTGVLLYNALPKKAKVGFMKFLAKKLPATLAKQATKAAVRHAASATTGIGAHPVVQGGLVLVDVAVAGWSIADLIAEYQREG